MKNLNEALLAFQRLNIEVTKNSKAQITERAAYTYADLPHVLEIVKPQLTACGLLACQTTRLDEQSVTVLDTEIIHVESGEKLHSSLPLYVDDKPQNFGSRLTYWRRYALLTILNLSPDDDDAQQLQQQYAPQQRQQAPMPKSQQYEPRQSYEQHEPQQQSQLDMGECPSCGSAMSPSKNGGKPYCRPCWMASKNGGR